MTRGSDEVTAVTAASAPRLVDAEERAAHLVVLSGTNVGQIYPLSERETAIGRAEGSAIQLMDAGISRHHSMVERNEDGVFVVRDTGSRNGTFVNNERVEEPYALLDGDKIQLGVMTILKFSYDDELEATYARKMYDAALRDGLTGVFNRRYFDERIQSEYSFCVRHGKALALLMIDLDHFKTVNDSYGHVAGDKILTEFAALLTRMIRAEDVLARYGGEEFAIICRDTDVKKASILAERIRYAAAAYDYVVGNRPIQVTVSIGVVSVPDRELQSPTEIIEAADEALYKAKAKGRNCIITRQVLS
ncbi:MAG: GGDEF domain-containing protein [Deltaproteobacteria bacterium]|nr:GGDEF domain-containing protein [Deltaproteobacteria bacterium]